MSKSRSLNKVQLIGNLTRDPVLKKTANGVTVCTFGMATNSSWKDAQGETKERAEFHSIVAWNKMAEVCAQLLSVGMLVFVEGELRTNVTEDEAGGKKYRTEIKMNDMILLDSKGKTGVGVDSEEDVQPEQENTGEEVNLF
ncbi:MAG: single-stranded DNA-binding protein [Candidatus Doudnabacteria bacterium]|nr:single-stranded DNA-binding protein [Candidatus Doudnabacteria bacterium]